MLKFTFSVALVMTLLTGTPPHALVTANEPCEATGKWGGSCDAVSDGEGVNVGGDITIPGHDPNPDPGPGTDGGGGGSGPSDGGIDIPEGPGLPPVPCVGPTCGGIVTILPTIPEITLSDIASFRPAAPTLIAEPAGLGVAGLPTNLVADSGTQTVPGTLFGREISVTFAPQRHIFSNGDGTQTVSATGGASWEQLGQAPFTPTATSHTYARPGTYVLSVTTVYSATVNYGELTRVVPGEITAVSAGQDLRILEARTGLVDQTCTENPRGPGC